jgi:uncharacterized protein YaiE (UPF0345 family)
LAAFMLYMLFIIGELAWKSKAGKLGTFILFFVLAFGMLGFVAKFIIQEIVGDLICRSSIMSPSVVKKANVYFDGKCVSHTVQLRRRHQEKRRRDPAVARSTFNTGAAEIMECVSGVCRYRIKGEDWQTSGAGQSFKVPGNSSFEIEVSGEPYHYVCHFA